MSGRSKQISRFLHAEHVEFEPEFKTWFETNHKAIVGAGDPAVWNRLELIPFEVNIPAKLPEHEQETRTEAMQELHAELQGILAWLVAGCRAWQARGLCEPEEVRLATERYRTEMDTISNFLAESCALRLGARVRTAELFRHYKTWCLDNNERTLTQKAFSMRMVERGFEKRPDSYGYLEFRGIEVCANANTAVHYSDATRLENFGLR